MTAVDSILNKMRLLESQYGELMSEQSQSWDEFIQGIQKYYEQQGVKNIPPNMIELLIKTIGIENAQSAAGKTMLQNMKKNPNRFLNNIMSSYNVDYNKVKDTFNEKLNTSDDKELKDMLGWVLDQMIAVESHASASHSLLDTMSPDLYSIRQSQDKQLRLIMIALKKLSKNTPQLMKAIENMARMLTKQKEEGSPLNGKDLTNKYVYLSDGHEGTVIIDSDDKGLTQEGLNAIADQFKSVIPNVSFDLNVIKAMKVPHVWILTNDRLIYEATNAVSAKIIDVDKTAVLPVEFKPIIDALEEDPETYLSAAKIIAKMTAGKERNELVDAFGSMKHSRKKMDNLSRDLGYDVDKYRGMMGITGDQNEKNRIRLPITSTGGVSAASRVLHWIKDIKPSYLQLTEKEVFLFGVMNGLVLKTPDFSIEFFKRPPQLNYIHAITIYNAKAEDFERYAKMKMRGMNLDIKQEGNNIRISNIR